jgi:hypothetical protein
MDGNWMKIEMTKKIHPFKSNTKQMMMDQHDIEIGLSCLS